MDVREFVKGFIPESDSPLYVKILKHYFPEFMQTIRYKDVKLQDIEKHMTLEQFTLFSSIVLQCANKPPQKRLASSIHPTNKTKYEISLNSVISDGPMFYPNIEVSNELISDTIEGVFFNGCADLIIHSKKYKYKGLPTGEEEDLKFPVDHFQKNWLHLNCLRISVMAYLLELKGVKIGKLYIILPNTHVEVPYKKWEVLLMFKYYKIQSKNDYSQKYTISSSSDSSTSNTPVGIS